MERKVALKVINPGLLNRSTALARFHQEVKAAARLSHPNIVQAYDADQAGDLHFLVMEYVEGTDMAAYLKRTGPLPAAEACDVARQVALGLQHAGENGMVHRDIKPHNLMRTPHGRVKILDFGLARLSREFRDSPHLEGESTNTGLTSENVVMGTADYMAPEQAQNPRAVDIRADIYSLGCTLYHLLAGHVPFPDGSTMQKVLAHNTATPPALEKVRPELSSDLRAVVAKMMARDPATRYQTPAEVAAALAPFAASGRADTKLQSHRIGRGFPRWSLVAAGALVVLGGRVSVALKGPQGNDSPGAEVQPITGISAITSTTSSTKSKGGPFQARITFYPFSVVAACR